MRAHLLIPVLAALLPLAGCWKILEVTDDGSTIPDVVADTGVDTGVDTSEDPVWDPAVDTFVDWAEDTAVDTAMDVPPDPLYPQCNDGLDNDGDDLYDMDDNDCTDPSDPIEGSEVGECTTDNHCGGGWLECNILTNECYEPPMGQLCDTCSTRADCGDGITDEDNPDVDWCAMAGPGGGNCTKDCREEYDCPRGFTCDGLDAPPGMCVAIAGCSGLDTLGSSCSGFWDCGWGGGLSCTDGTCTYRCEEQHDCPTGFDCTDAGVCQ